jgi:hypothetical protein
MWYSRIKIAQNAAYVNEIAAASKRKEIIDQALQNTGIADLNSMAGVPQWQNANNYITQQVLNPQNRFINTQLLEQEWEQAKQNLINQYNLRNYPQINQQAPSRVNQEQLIAQLIDQAKEAHQTMGQTGNKLYTSPGWNFINEQVAKNPYLSKESKQILKQKFSQEAQALHAQRPTSMVAYPGQMNFNPTKLSPADQQLAKRLFQTNDLSKLTVDQKSQFLDFKNKYTPEMQQQMLQADAQMRQIDRESYQTYWKDVSEFNKSYNDIRLDPARFNEERRSLIEQIQNDNVLNENQKKALINGVAREKSI